MIRCDFEGFGGLGVVWFVFGLFFFSFWCVCVCVCIFVLCVCVFFPLKLFTERLSSPYAQVEQSIYALK